MDVRGTSQAINKIQADAIAIALFKGEKADDGLLKTLDKAVDKLVSSVIKSEEFSGKEGETAYFHLTGSGLRSPRLLLIGCGERADYKSAQLSQMAGTAARFLRGKNAKTIAIVPRAEGDVEKVAQTVISGAIMGLFDPDKYRTKDKEERQIERFEVVIEDADKKALERGAERGRVIGEYAKFTRDLANEPGGYITPTNMAGSAEKRTQKSRQDGEVLDHEKNEKTGVGSFLRVS